MKSWHVTVMIQLFVDDELVETRRETKGAFVEHVPPTVANVKDAVRGIAREMAMAVALAAGFPR
jgi:hypothetical protein